MVGQERTPGRGDLIWLSFDTHKGHEQKGKRPALVLSPKAYNEKVGLALMCLITTKKKGYPFEVDLPEDCPIDGVILSDQVKSLDWRARESEIAGTAPSSVLSETLQKLCTLLT
ncbi:MAG: endoribonuclease MazF [Candidatus Fermentibacteraceae bacterium]|nr:endoribonuclease MazF [Candidatus Fermentibacteraceae bacterium]MBN2859660.1 endoribonuclease MazF [Sphaerochaetaceae bacterium]